MLIKSDVLIIGSGLAGLYAALRLDPALNVVVLTKDRMEESNSYLAQGGIAVAYDKETDNPEYHYNDTVRAGAGICNPETLRILVDEGEKNIDNLMKLGVSFDQVNRKISLTREGGHSRRRILHINGDATGRGIMEVLIRDVKNRANIQIREHSFCFDLLVKNNRCIGAMALEEDGLTYCYAKSVILAAGGIGMIYEITTNSSTLTGDAIAMAERAGAEIKDMEFIQFHPTVFHSQEKKRFLISEALRGEGAVLRNINGERFMDKYDERQELAPRDVVSRAIMREMEKTNSDHVYLDLRHLDHDFIFNRFPNITKKCKEYGIDISTEMIPVSPAQHYLIGGIKTDKWGRTSIPGLYACGETACTGVHGANRLASNSLLEALVFANRATYQINKGISKIDDISMDGENRIDMIPAAKCDVFADRESIQAAMRKYAGIRRSKSGLKLCLRVLNEIEDTLQDKRCLNKEFMECFNMLTIAKLITRQALKREESIGTHYLLKEGI